MSEKYLSLDGLSYFKGMIVDLKEITLSLSGWTGTTAPYTQTVSNSDISENDNPLLVKIIDSEISEDELKTYEKNFVILAAGINTTANGSVTFKVYKKPTADIVVGLKGV